MERQSSNAGQGRLQRAPWWPPLVHRGVGICDVVERQGEVEHLPGVDLSVDDQLDQVREEAANGRRPAADPTPGGTVWFR